MVTDDLSSILAILVPHTSPGELSGSIYRSIIKPAADLVHQLHLAPNIFSLKWPVRTAFSRLEVYECINLASGGMMLDLSQTTQTHPARRDVHYLFDVAPGLFVERIESEGKSRPKAIVKPNVLVYKGDEEVPQKPTIAQWLWDSTGGPRRPSRATTMKSKLAHPDRPFKL